MGKSNFMFQIKGTCADFEHKLRTFHKENVSTERNESETLAIDGVACYQQSVRLSFTDEDNGCSLFFVRREDGKCTVTTSRNDYRYDIFEGEDGRTTVVFTGPINALWQQYMLPKISYIRGTLMGKWEEEEDYLPIADCMARRYHASNQDNEQDIYIGDRLNGIFWNEIPYR